jgi:hypothetical protein
MTYLGFQFLHHPPYSPNLAPSDYHLFLDWKHRWKVASLSETEVIAAAETWLDEQLSEFFELLAKVRTMG